MQCPSCGASRVRTGVLFPARKLCECENQKCDCGQPAVIVEFQAPVKGEEPPLPAASDKVAKFYCASHAEFHAAWDDANVRRLQSPRPREKMNAGNVDPVWNTWGNREPPSGARSSAKVRCAECRDIHPLAKRKMWNGTESQCPKCGHNVYTREDDDG